ncbi:(2Fe-2S) ferredoxin domain-containing protein [Patescibacteria group bacterium]|nr:(2Fe-2S) ferredoxin domain-containing protein [Patescibacteria group bacterium]
MRLAEKPFQKLVLVCTNRREDGRECCAAKGSIELYHALKAAVKAMDPSIRVSQSGCLDNCSTGTTVVIMPDALWLGAVTEADIIDILAYLKDGTRIPFPSTL